MARMERADVSGQNPCVRRGANKADADAADFATSGPLNNQLGMLGLRDHALGLDPE